VRNFATLVALALSACAPPGYAYDVGNFTRPHPTAALCASRGQQYDADAQECFLSQPSSPAAAPMQRMAETYEQGKAWNEQIKHGVCDRLSDRRTDLPADIAECNRLYAQVPLCVSYQGWATVWYPMVDDPNPEIKWFAVETDVINTLGDKMQSTDPAYYRSPQYRDMLHRLLKVTFSPGRKRWADAKQFGDAAYKACMEGHPF
jgi:hypothetical protein